MGHWLQRGMCAAGLLYLAGCTSTLYNANNDKLAQEARQSFADSGAGKALVAEREALLKNQDERQALVARTQLALRDAQLAALLAPNDHRSWARVDLYLNERAGVLGGQVAAPACSTGTLGASLQGAAEARSAASVKSAQLRLALGNAGKHFAPSCARRAEGLPADLAGNPVAAALFGAFSDECVRAERYEACVVQQTPGGRIAAVRTERAAIAADRAQVDATVKVNRAAYRKALEDADGAAGQAGAASAAAAALEQKLEALKLGRGEEGRLKNHPVLKHVADRAELASLRERLDLIDRYLAALAGTGDASDATRGSAPHRVQLLARLVDSVTDTPRPPVAGLLMLAEQYRLDMEAVQQRIARTEAVDAIYARQYDDMVAELVDLQAAGKWQAEAKVKGCDRQSLMQNIGKPAADFCRQASAAVLKHLALSWTRGRLASEQADYALIGQSELAVLDESETALLKTEGIARAGIEQVAALQAAGVKPEQVASLWQAFWVAVIGVRVK